MIYEPAEDSYLLAHTLQKYLENKPKTLSILDMGSGSGVQAQTCKQLGFKNVTTADIHQEVITHLKKHRFKATHTNLFSNIKNTYDLIIFNPPYLPDDKREPEDSKHMTTGGKKGYEIIVRFLDQAHNYLTARGEMLLLFSSLSKPSVILTHARKHYTTQKLSEQKIPFERLYVYTMKKKHQ